MSICTRRFWYLLQQSSVPTQTRWFSCFAAPHIMSHAPRKLRLLGRGLRPMFHKSGQFISKAIHWPDLWNHMAHCHRANSPWTGSNRWFLYTLCSQNCKNLPIVCSWNRWCMQQNNHEYCVLCKLTYPAVAKGFWHPNHLITQLSNVIIFPLRIQHNFAKLSQRILLCVTVHLPLEDDVSRQIHISRKRDNAVMN